ncbi:MAG: SPFH domain-containing protein, partial [Allosphingosinicella sp.]
YFIAQRYVDAIGMFATSPNAKTILFPVEATALIGTLGGIGELAKDALGGGGGASGPPARRGPFEGGGAGQ